MLQTPRQQALVELRHLLIVPQHDRVPADQVNSADVTVEIDADAGQFSREASLLDMD